MTFVLELTIPTEQQPLVDEVSANFCGKRVFMVSTTVPHGRTLEFLHWSRYYSFQIAPKLYSRSSVNSAPDTLLLRKSGKAGI
jgi:hypothetical protein